jgi:hypothetical protein
MRTYEVLKIVNFDGGQITLDKDQAAARQHKLKKIKGNLYEVTGKIQFKVGEIIGLEENMIKRVHQVCLRDLSAPQVGDVEEGAESENQDSHNNETTEDTADNENSNGDPDNSASGQSAENGLAQLAAEDLESMHWKQVRKLVEDNGGEWVNKPKGIEFLKQKIAENAAS